MIVVASRWLRLNLSSWLLWLAGLAALAAVYVPLYRRYEAEGLFGATTEPDGLSNVLRLQDLGTPTGFLGTTILGPMGLLVLVAAGVMTGAGAIAGDEERGLLDGTLSRAVPRIWVYLGRWVAVLAGTGALGAVFTLLVAVAIRTIGLPIPLSGTASAGIALTLLGLLYATVALAVGAATGRSGLAKVASSALAIAAFAMWAIGTRGVALSPVHWALAPVPLENGLAVGGVALLLLCTALTGVLGMVGFLVRDVGRWRVDTPGRP